MTKILDIAPGTLNDLPTNERQIVLRPPFDHFYSAGTVYLASDSQRRCVLMKSRTEEARELGLPRAAIVTYANYIYRVDHFKRCGKDIPEGYEVDHIDNNKLNDNLGNLQHITRSQNVVKETALIPMVYRVIVCAACGQRVFKYAKESAISTGYASGKTLGYCSRTCSAYNDRKLSIDGGVRQWLMANQKIAEVAIFGHQYEDYHHDNYPRCELSDDYFDTAKPLYHYSGSDHLRDFVPAELRSGVYETPAELHARWIDGVQSGAAQGLTPVQIAKQLGVTGGLVIRLARKNDIELNIVEPIPLTDERIAQFVEARMAGYGVAALCRIMRMSSATASALNKQYGLTSARKDAGYVRREGP